MEDAAANTIVEDAPVAGLAEDPSTQGGYKVVYSREAPLELRLQTNEEAPQEIGTLEAIMCKVLVQGDAARPTSVKVELSSESDLFFHYTHVADERTFKAMREEQRLMVEFPEYASVLATSFSNAVKEPNMFLAVFIMNQEGLGRLDFIQNVSFKFVELLSVPFNRSPDDLIRQQITYRYASVKGKLAVMSSRLQEVVNVVKVKNPSLLLQLTGGAAGATAAGGSAGSGKGASSSSSSSAAPAGGSSGSAAPVASGGVLVGRSVPPLAGGPGGR